MQDPLVQPAPVSRPVGEFLHDGIEIDRHRDHFDPAVAERPDLGGPVGVDLETVAVRVGEIHGLADIVVRESVDPPVRIVQVPDRQRQGAPGGDADRDMVEPRGAGRPGSGVLLFGEHDETGAAPGRRQRRRAPPSADQPEPEHVQVERERTLEVAHAQVRVPDLCGTCDAELVSGLGHDKTLFCSRFRTLPQKGLEDTSRDMSVTGPPQRPCQPSPLTYWSAGGIAIHRIR